MPKTLKHSWLLVPALFIDGLQWFLQIVLTVIGPLGLGGAVAGCYVGSKLVDSCAGGGVIGTVVGTVVNTFGEPITAPIGIMIGFVLSFIISLVFGTLLVLLLTYNGMYAPTRTVLAYAGEIAPGLNMLPAWTGLVAYCLWKEGFGTKGAVLGLAQSALKFNLPDTPIGNAFRRGNDTGMRSIARMDPRPLPNREQAESDIQTFNRAPLSSKNFDGIRRPAVT